MSTSSVTSDRTDYHVHCHCDGCAAKEMTLAAIYAEAVKAGMREICVVKHYSHELPNHTNPAWGHTLAQHAAVEETIRRLGVTRGTLATR